jgi:hypothetical protein
MAWWNPIDYATEGVKEAWSQLPGTAAYDARKPSSPFYGEKKTVVTPGRAFTPSEAQGLGVGAPQVQSASTSNLNSATTSGPVAGAGANLAGFDQAIGNTNSAINRLGSQLNSGNSAIDASYQNALKQLLLGRNQSQAAYDTSKQQTAQDYIGAKNTIGANAGASLQGLLRLLGSRGAGGGSAATEMAPQAVAREATLQRADAGNAFGQNSQALDTNWNNYLTGYNNSVMDVNSQRDQQRQGLQSNIESNRATLLQTLAQLSAQRDQAAGGNGVAAAQPFLDQANRTLDSLASYNVAPINYQTQAFNAPELASYAMGSAAGPTFQGQAPQNDYFSPYLAALLGKKQQVNA